MTPEEADKLNLESAKDNGNDSAFPNQDTSGYLHYGLTKREYMATQLMSGAMAGHCSPEEAMGRAIRGVDLLLIELNKNK